MVDKKAEMPGLRLKSGIPGLDELTCGGYPSGGIHIVSGPPGSGKSLLGLHFLVEGAKHGETGIYISLEETQPNIHKSMTGFGLDEIAGDDRERVMVIDLTTMRESIDKMNWEPMTGSLRGEAIQREVVSFRSLQAFLTNIFRIHTPKRIVIDSLVAVGLSYDKNSDMREDLFVFCAFLRREGVTSLLITESDDESGLKTRFNDEGFVGDSFIALGLEKIKGELRRSITVRKMRFTDHDTSQRPMFLGKGGITVKSDAGMF
jgi:circadian clock protein KaiC